VGRRLDREGLVLSVNFRKPLNGIVDTSEDCEPPTSLQFSVGAGVRFDLIVVALGV
jgi:hypothetical protein